MLQHGFMVWDFAFHCYFLLGKAYVGKKDSINACDNFIKSAKLGDKEAREMLKKHCIEK